MTFSILFSPSKGFWSDEDGWVTHCTSASKLPINATIQVCFVGVRDMLRVNSKDISTLDTCQLFDWLNLNFKSLIDEIQNPNCVNSVIEHVNNNTHYILALDRDKGISVINTREPLKIEKAPLIPPFLKRF